MMYPEIRRLAPLLLIWMWGGATLAAAHQQESVTVRLHRTHVVLNQPLILMEDVAEVSGSPASLVQRVKKLDLDTLGGADEEAVVTREQVAFRLRLAGLQTQQFSVSGSETVQVDRYQWLQSKRELESRLKQHFEQHFQLMPGQLELQLRAESQVPLSRLRCDVTTAELVIDYPARLPNGAGVVNVAVVDEVGQSIRVSLPFNSRVLPVQTVAKRPISRGEPIDPQAITRIVLPQGTTSVHPVSGEQVVGQIAQRDIQPMEPITASSITPERRTPEIAIRANQVVALVVRKGNVTIKLKNGRARQAGAVDDVIDVINPKNPTQRLLGRVVDSTTVEIID